MAVAMLAKTLAADRWKPDSAPGYLQSHADSADVLTRPAAVRSIHLKY